VPVTGKPVIPADNGVTGEYRYRPVLRIPIPIFRERHAVMHVGSRVTITISEIMNKRIENIVSPYITQYKKQCVACIMITPALPHIGIGNVLILMNVVGLTYNYTGLLQPVVWIYGRGPKYRYRPVL
jgi:hypothetical protein